MLFVDTETGLPTRSLGEEPRVDRRWRVAFAADGSLGAAFPVQYSPPDPNPTIRLWRPGDQGRRDPSENLWTLLRPEAFVETGALNHDGKRLAVVVAGPTRLLMGWDLATSSRLAKIPLPAVTVHRDWLTNRSPFDTLVFAADGRTVLLAGNDGGLRVYDLVAGREVGRLLGDAEALTARPAFSPDGRLLALASESEGASIRLIEWASWAERRRFQPPAGYVSALAFSPDGRTLASGHQDSTIVLWDVHPPPG